MRRREVDEKYQRERNELDTQINRLNEEKAKLESSKCKKLKAHK